MSAPELPRLRADRQVGAWPPELVSPVQPRPVPEPRLAAYSPEAAAMLGLDPALPEQAEFIATLAGNLAWPGAEPAATAYAGHQFGVWAGRLGDGRAMLLGELRAGDGQRWEVQLKGAGPTPYSRHADGRAVLRSSLREFLASEAMHGLGIPTTRALAVVASPLPVRRETLEPAAILTRLAPSHLRFGHFEWCRAQGREDWLRQLADATIAHHHPELAEQPDRYRLWLTEVVRRTARLMARWQCVGFCHGVMNTDNFSILGLTLDYGPYGFMDAFDAGHVCNHSDEGGRYAYDRQPSVGQWNCAQLLNACLPLLAERGEAAVEIATGILDSYGPVYAEAAVSGWRVKLGLVEAREDDPDLINRYLSLLHRSRADFTLSFRRLSGLNSQTDTPDAGRDHIADPAREPERCGAPLERRAGLTVPPAPISLRENAVSAPGYDAWVSLYRQRLRAENSDDTARSRRMDAVNPLYVLRNHLAQIAIERAENGDYDYTERLRRALIQPYVEQPEAADLAAEPPPERRQIAVSCSS